MKKRLLFLLALSFPMILSSCVNNTTNDNTNTTTNEEKNDSFMVIWKNDDGNILQIDKSVKKGTIPEYKGKTPTKDKDIINTYVFKGWTPEIKEVTKATTYTAVYEEIKNEYNIVFKNYDGTVLKTYTLNYGDSINFDFNKPTRENEVGIIYKFSGYDDETPTVFGDKVYTAMYDKYLFKNFRWDYTNDNTASVYYETEDGYKYFFEKANVEIVETKDATCTDNGYIKYKMSYNGKSEEITFELSNKGHDYEFKVVWDGYKAKLVGICKNDPSHKEEYDMGIEIKEKVERTKTTNGYMTLVASYGTYSEEKTFVLEAYGDDYEFDSFIWKDGYEIAQAKYVSKTNNEDYILLDATVTVKVLQDSTCYTAKHCQSTASYDGHTESRDYYTMIMGHDYKFDSIVWDNYTPSIKFVCKNDPSHIKYETDNIDLKVEVIKEATNLEDGIKLYTATYDGHTSTKEEIIPKTSE